MSPAETRPPLPPFSRDDALAKVRAAEDAWNGRRPEAVSLAYTPDCAWRNRDEFLEGRDAIVAFLERKWSRELDYRLIRPQDRLYHWPEGSRPPDHPGLSELGL